jgi:hypothetical protein
MWKTSVLKTLQKSISNISCTRRSQRPPLNSNQVHTKAGVPKGVVQMHWVRLDWIGLDWIVAMAEPSCSLQNCKDQNYSHRPLLLLLLLGRDQFRYSSTLIIVV